MSRCTSVAKGAVAIIGDSKVSGLKEELLPNKKHQVKIRCCKGATVEDMFDYVKPILKWKPMSFCKWGLITPKT